MPLQNCEVSSGLTLHKFDEFLTFALKIIAESWTVDHTAFRLLLNFVHPFNDDSINPVEHFRIGHRNVRRIEFQVRADVVDPFNGSTTS